MINLGKILLKIIIELHTKISYMQKVGEKNDRRQSLNQDKGKFMRKRIKRNSLNPTHKKQPWLKNKLTKYLFCSRIRQ